MTPPILPRALRSERDRWDRLSRDPYYAVLNVEEHRDERLTVDDRARFFESGRRDLEQTIEEIRRWIAPGFAPRAAVDFGCGVGRLLMPLARVCGHVTGVDISRVMLEEATRNCAAAGIRNVDFALPEEYFSQPVAEAPEPDFVHAYIVFQHMPPAAGLWVADALVRRLARGGVGALHFTYARRASPLRRVVHLLRRVLPGANMLVNLAQGRPIFEPLIPMNAYDLGRLYALLGDHGCSHVHARLTDHGGHLGAMLLFGKP